MATVRLVDENCDNPTVRRVFADISAIPLKWVHGEA
jgi:hypothetical protein